MDSETLLHAHLPDGGPLYVETDLTRLVAEPFNAATAVPFLLIALYRLYLLRGRYRENAFLSLSLVLLAVGGIGGSGYHAFRVSRVLYLMDIVPIAALALAVSAYLWMKVLKNKWSLAALVIPVVVAHPIAFATFNRQTATNVSYLLLAALILIPVFVYLRRSAYRDARLVFSSVGFFSVGLLFRLLDPYRIVPLSMGTHWLWHTFTAISVALLCEYIYRLTNHHGSAVPADKKKAA